MNIYWTGAVLAFYILSCAVAGIFGYKYEYAQCSVHDEAHDLQQSQNTVAATNHVVGVVATQGNISQEASSAYAKDFISITGLYSNVGVQSTPPGPVNSMPTVRSTPVGSCPGSSTKSKVYHLTSQQCDLEEAKFNRLWNWAQAQASVK